MKNILKYLIISIGLIFSLPAFAYSNLDTGLRWEYYDYYSNHWGRGKVNMLSYSLTGTGDNGSQFQWILDSNKEYNQYNGDWEYVGDIHSSEKPLEIREEGNKIYLIITPEYTEANGLYEVDEDAVETRMVTPDFEYGFYPGIPFKKIKIEEDLPVLLYDFDAEVGDSYTTLLYGSLLNTVHVVGTSFRDDILGGVKEVRIFADYTIRHFSLDYDPDSEWNGRYDFFTLIYLEKIGNITDGTFTVLNPTWFDEAGMTFFETEINNVYDSEGNIVYKGRNFDPDAYTGGITDLAEDQRNSRTDKVFDLHGREVAKTLPGSIYIRDGRKFVAE